ncbi:asparagine synthase (glutamine-hydrolyzing) [Gaetbulibacter aquiaggeris]|uniref:asparagine synthase (glutamine-hydrolyzing) n=1 Tax=Gaetbulibacter aquiaggeris TaxID=1735373 RepID=A0ABW7MQY3_9FLAO
MCGINGFITKTEKSLNELQNNLTLMNNMIIHRGPDDDGIFKMSRPNFSIAMGMRRLSIIDLSSGKQPIYSDDKKIVIVFNGEIYNYQDLRKDLQAQGVNFNTHSDTEVILKLYEKEGTSSFKKLDGMFAFSMYDFKKQKVFIARDFFGEKPLYYTQTNDGFIWASELKSLIKLLPNKPSINKTGLNLYFKLTYIPAPFTIYEDIKKLESNHFITYDLSKHAFDISIIEEKKTITKSNPTFDTAKKKVKDLVEKSVNSRSVSDVPIGTFLSGGVDSSVVSLCLSRMNESKINTFSIGFEKKSYDETDKSKIVSQLINSNHHEFIIGEKDLESNIDDILLNFDEPFADSSSLPTYIVANKTANHVKVALTGDGGDEVFGGYNKYHMGSINNKYTKYIPKAIHSIIKKSSNPFLKTKDDVRGKKFIIEKILNSIDYTGNYYWDIISLGYPSETLSNYLLPEHIDNNVFNYYKKHTNIPSPKDLNEYREIDKHISLEGDMLVKVDRTSMLNSLECRAPFLNKELWEYTFTLPDSFLMKGWDKKHILKEAFKEDFPKDFLNKSKSGFGVPVGDWLRTSLRKDLESYVEDHFLKTQNIFQKENIQKLVSEHLNGKDNTFKVWTFYCFQKWYKKNYLN